MRPERQLARGSGAPSKRARARASTTSAARPRVGRHLRARPHRLRAQRRVEAAAAPSGGGGGPRRRRGPRPPTRAARRRAPTRGRGRRRAGTTRAAARRRCPCRRTRRCGRRSSRPAPPSSRRRSRATAACAAGPTGRRRVQIPVRALDPPPRTGLAARPIAGRYHEASTTLTAGGRAASHAERRGRDAARHFCAAGTARHAATSRTSPGSRAELPATACCAAGSWRAHSAATPQTASTRRQRLHTPPNFRDARRRQGPLSRASSRTR